ncbi:LysR substrate-binding domain-containing protein [Novacetimonas hansenii]|uniref:LysR substrate-binding domain-containing protein n=1 Tax=Novacetimonas hansenii TaxID=436 RepID=UPI00095014CD|nr:LysR substrate-binding domain-containing protein [Novacetimonas hansenii]
MRQPFDLDLLRTLVAVAETGSFSRAGIRIGRSQSAVSMQIQKLEAMVGQKLLVRGGRSVTPSRVGNDLVAYGRRLLRLSDEAWASMNRPSVTGTVRIGVPEDYSASFLPRILESFGHIFPHVVVEVVCEPTFELTDLILKNLIDLAIVTRFNNQPMEILRREPMVWVASPAHAAWEKDPLPVAMFQTCAARSNILKALTDAERSYRCAYSSSSLTGMITIVQTGLAVAGLARCSVPSTVSIVGEKEGLPPINDLEIGLLRSSASEGLALQHFQNIIREKLSFPRDFFF